MKLPSITPHWTHGVCAAFILCFFTFATTACQSQQDDREIGSPQALSAGELNNGHMASDSDAQPGATTDEQWALNAPPTPEPMPENDITVSRRNAITRAVETCSPAVVGINVTEVRRYSVRDPWMELFMGRRGDRVYEEEIKGVGSGFIISSDGYVLTNEHVAGGASEIIISMTNGEQYSAKLIGADAVSDVALLKIQRSDIRFPYLELANSDKTIIGEWAISFGNPFGLFAINAKPTVTVGVISNTGLNFTQDDKVYRGMLQTDASISSGNSGGPLVNGDGKVIGMNATIFSTAQTSRGAGSIGIGFAIPINRVMNVVDRLKRDGNIDRNYSVGLNVGAVDKKLARALKLERERGVFISEIYRRSPAEAAGLEPGDIIVEIDDERILRPEDVQVILNDGVAGEEMRLTILRDGKELNKKLELRPVRRR